jgi:hypothetical protein
MSACSDWAGGSDRPPRSASSKERERGVEAPLARAGRASEGDADFLGGRQHELIPLVPLLDLGLLIRRCVTDRRIPATPTVAIPSAATPTATNLRITQTKCDQP